MANSKSSQIKINLDNPKLNFNINKTNIHKFEGFQENNCPYEFDRLVNLYSSEFNSDSDVFVTKDLKQFRINGTSLEKKTSSTWTNLHTFNSYIDKIEVNYPGYEPLSGTYSCILLYKENKVYIRDTSIFHTSIDVTSKPLNTNIKRIGYMNNFAVVLDKKVYVVINNTINQSPYSFTDSDSQSNIIVIGQDVIFNYKQQELIHYDFSSNSWHKYTSITDRNGQNSISASKILLSNSRRFVTTDEFLANGYLEFILQIDDNGDLCYDNYGSPYDHYIPTDASAHYEYKETTFGDRHCYWTLKEKWTDEEIYKNNYTVFTNTNNPWPGLDTDPSGNLVTGTSVNYEVIVGYPFFRLLYNNGYLTGISVVQESGYRGSIITPWYKVDEVYEDSGSIGYKMNNKLYIAKIYSSGSGLRFNMFNQRYLIFNTADFLNTFDTETETWIHSSDDWNNRVVGTMFVANPLQYDYLVIGSQTNNDYITSGFRFPGALSNTAQIRVEPDKELLIDYLSYNQNDLIDYFRSIIEIKTTLSKSMYQKYQDEINRIESIKASNNNKLTGMLADFMITGYNNVIEMNNVRSIGTTPIYVCSFGVTTKIIKKDLLDLPYNSESNILLLNTPLYATYDDNSIYVIFEQESNQAVCLNQYGIDYPLYYNLSMDNSYSSIFQIQNSLFGISNNYIYKLTLNSGVLQSQGKCSFIKGLEFVASNNYGAYFWSQTNNKIYIFKGDLLLEEAFGIEDVDRIVESKFNIATNEIFILTDKYLIVGDGKQMYKINNTFTKITPSYDIEFDNVFFTDKGFVVKGHDYTNKYIKSYIYTESSGYTLEPLKLITNYYGEEDNSIINIDCVYITLFNKDTINSHYIKIKGKTKTDKIFDITEKSFTINPTDWSSQNTFYIRYQPQFQKCVGLQLEIETDCSISSLIYGITKETNQISKDNI